MLEQHKAAIQNAERRKDERPVDMPSWGELVAEYGMTLTRRNLENLGSSHMLITTAIGKPYAAFDASFHELTKCMIKDLRIEIHHRGAYLLLRFFSETSRETAVSNLVDDENGDAVLFSLYMQKPEVVRKAESILKRGSVVILKEPYFKVGVGGSYMLRVDHPSDII
jgi:hypothetical protein